MLPEQTGAEGTTHPVLGDSFVGGFAPAVPRPLLTPKAEPVEAPKEEPKPEPVEVKAQPPVEKDPPLAEVIRARREAVAQAQAEKAKAQSKDEEIAKLKAEIDQLRRDSDFEADPVAFAKARKWDREKQLLYGQTLLYDLAPDKAPPNLAMKLFETKQEREKRLEAEKAQAERDRAQVEAQRQQFETYVAAVDQAASAFEPGSYPESEAWFSNHDAYVKSLIATANNMAEVANKEGRRADLSPGNVAKVLEAEVAERMRLRDERRSKRQAPKEVAQQAPAKAPGGGVKPTESTQGLTGAGSPRPKAQTDSERLARAVEAGWGGRR